MTVAASMKTIKSDDMFPEKDKLSDLHLQFHATYVRIQKKKRCKVKKLDFPLALDGGSRPELLSFIQNLL